MSGENEASETATVVSDAVENVVEAAIESAETRAEVAEEVAEAVTESARHSSIMTMVEDFKRENETWRNEMGSELSRQAETIRQMSDQQSTLLEGMAVMSAALTQQSIPAPSPEPASTSEDAVGLANPVEATAPNPAPEIPLAPRKSQRRI